MSVTINKTKTGGATKFSPTNYAQVAKGFFFNKDLFCPPLSKKKHYNNNYLWKKRKTNRLN